jgi:NAD(P)-dependent dehydrogenase (short-subunit alcohol dehydrogenase family)
MRARPVAVVTGASAGVGRATAVGLSKAGCDVGLVARGRAGLEAAASEVKEAGGQAAIAEADVARFEEVDEAASQIERQLGSIDIWVNNSMTTVFAPLLQVEPADFRRAIDVTFLGQVWGTRAALARMRPRDRGTIVNVGSALAFMGIPLQSAYCASKFACRGFFESVRAELLHDRSKVRMCMVHLPAVNTPQFDWCATAFDRQPQPVPPIYQPEVVAERIVATALVGRRARIVGGWNKLLVAVARVAPGLANRYAAIGAWETQLTSRRIDPHRPSNLGEAVDADVDHGSHGSFDGQAGGFLDPSFRRTLPQTAGTLGRAVLALVQEKGQEVRGRAEWSRRRRG